MSRTKKDERLSRVSWQIAEAARKKLLQDAPELLRAIYLMRAEETEEAGALRADGLAIWYHPESVVRDHLAGRACARPRDRISRRRDLSPLLPGRG